MRFLQCLKSILAIFGIAVFLKPFTAFCFASFIYSQCEWIKLGKQALACDLAPAEAKIFVPRSKIQFSKKFPSLFRKKLLYLK